ncbi:MAG: hypothetical protein ACREQN_17615 [Candidatus Binataceae bacterium]
MSSCYAAPVIAALLLLAVVAGCTPAVERGTSALLSSTTSTVAAVSSTDQPSAKPGGIDVTGVWEGTRVDGCDSMQLDTTRCNAVMNLGLTMLQEGDRVSGFYRCSINTVNCYNMDETGVIKNGEMGRRLLSFRVMLDDGSSCIFNSMPKGDRMSGGFICLQGGAVLERGHWQAQRSY